MRLRLLPVLLSAVALTACGAQPTAPSSNNKLEVAVGFYPYQFLAEKVGGDDVQITNLTKPGGEPHDLELTPQQVASLSQSDLVVYARGFQPAVDAAVDQQAPDRAFDVLTAVELRSGGQIEEDLDTGGKDPHVWLDPMRFATIATAVAEQLAERAPERATAFRERATTLGAELRALDSELRAGFASCVRRQIVTSHEAYGYLAGAYGLEQVAISGLSPDAEATLERLAEVAQIAKEGGVTTIFFEGMVSPKVAESLARDVGAKAVELNPLEGAPATGDYLSAMRADLAILRTALDCP